MEGIAGICPLCVKHSKIVTNERVQVWIETGNNGESILVSDSSHEGGGVNALQIAYCPLCGRELAQKKQKRTPEAIPAADQTENPQKITAWIATDKGLKLEETEIRPERDKEVVYIAGRLGDSEENHEKFMEKEAELTGKGNIVLNPAIQPRGLSHMDYMRTCFAMMESADVVYFLEGWKDSDGAYLERVWCEYVGKPMIFENGDC